MVDLFLFSLGVSLVAHALRMQVCVRVRLRVGLSAVVAGSSMQLSVLGCQSFAQYL
jgi:hypothetical protein